MDTQLKRGMLDVCVLSSLRDGDSYGYNIIKEVKPYIEISESTLYPILRRLEGAGYITERSEEFNGRLRKYYHITPEGLNRIEYFKNDWKEIISVYNYVTREDDKNDEK